MNNKEFINALAARTEKSQKSTKLLIDSLVELLADTLEEGDTLNVQSFGAFEVKKKKERIIVNQIGYFLQTQQCDEGKG